MMKLTIDRSRWLRGGKSIQGDPQRTLEWYAGQILDTLEAESWFAVNSLINCCDKFAPEEPSMPSAACVQND